VCVFNTPETKSAFRQLCRSAARPWHPGPQNDRIAPPEGPGLGIVPDMGLLGRPAAVIDWGPCLTAPQNLWENFPPPEDGADPRAWMHVGGRETGNCTVLPRESRDNMRTA